MGSRVTEGIMGLAREMGRGVALFVVLYLLIGRYLYSAAVGQYFGKDVGNLR